ncbi:MAG: alpha/beta fold hydrolase, partial [Bacillota bacterium]
GTFIDCVIDDGGRSDVWIYAVESGQNWQVSEAKRSAGSVCWHPSGNKMAYIQDGNLMTASFADGEWKSRAVMRTAPSKSSPSYSPDGRQLAFIREGAVWILDLDEGTQRSFVAPGDGTILPATFAAGHALNWSPSGEMLFFHFRDSDKGIHLGVSTAEEGALLFQTTWRRGPAMGATWLDDERLLYVRSSDRNTVREFCVLTFPPDAADAQKKVAGENRTSAPSTIEVDEEVIYRQEARGTPGPLWVSGAWAEPERGRILLISEDDGWAHLYLYDPDAGTMEQMTSGQCEDFGHMGDEPCWSPRGRHVCYSSNRGSSGERQLWILDADEGSTHQLTELAGTNVQPKWCPDGSQIAFVHCDPHRSADVWILPVDRTSPECAVDRPDARQITRTMPSSWTADKCIEPEEVSFEGADGWDIRGYLLAPSGSQQAAENSLPALVWVHGGPIRQMRYGFHPSHGYAFFYAVSQYLAHRGYTTLMVNFRGGIGYGREFRNGLHRKMGVDDVMDVIAAGRYLKNLPYVDETRVGVWGISYGGYMTLAALTKHPDEFSMGVNIAGIWDFAQWNDWITERHGRQLGGFEVFFDGSPAESPELYRIGSPCTYHESLQRPLINLHGTADANVDFAQMDRIVKDCVESGKEYEAHYYPDEVHLFQHRSTWADALTRIERAFDCHLKA